MLYIIVDIGALSPAHLADPLLYCTVLYCTVLYCTVLYCTVLYCTRGLLRRKAEEGVRVLVLIWNDKSSGAATGREGMMG